MAQEDESKSVIVCEADLEILMLSVRPLVGDNIDNNNERITRVTK